MQAAGTAPSGAHCQPWRFVICKSAEVKAALREIVEVRRGKPAPAEAQSRRGGGTNEKACMTSLRRPVHGPTG